MQKNTAAGTPTRRWPDTRIGAGKTFGPLSKRPFGLCLSCSDLIEEVLTVPSLSKRPGNWCQYFFDPFYPFGAGKTFEGVSKRPARTCLSRSEPYRGSVDLFLFVEKTRKMVSILPRPPSTLSE